MSDLRYRRGNEYFELGDRVRATEPRSYYPSVGNCGCRFCTTEAYEEGKVVEGCIVWNELGGCLEFREDSGRTFHLSRYEKLEKIT